LTSSQILYSIIVFQTLQSSVCKKKKKKAELNTLQKVTGHFCERRSTVTFAPDGSVGGENFITDERVKRNHPSI